MESSSDPMLLTARQAADRLGVKLDTLYAYVSRGRLRSVRVPGSRERRYPGEDVEALAQAGEAPARAAAEALIPVIGSSICLIEDGRLYYRGADAVALAESASLEDIAAVLWQAEPGDAGPAPPPLASSAPGAGSGAGPRSAALIERCQIRLAALAQEDLPALDLTGPGVVRTGRRILAELASCVGDGGTAAGPVHRRLADAWGAGPAGADILRRCLVLIADHELNASTFVARCVASTGATPYAVVLAALAALSGRRHGGASVRAEALLREIARAGEPMAVMAGRLARGEDLPAFGHPLYPGGDPRAAAILSAIGAALPEPHASIEAAAAAGRRLSGQPPNVDFALAAAAVALDLPENAALALFLMGRTVGWIAHAIEQYQSGTLIRPRARYLGPRPLEPERG